MGQPTLCVPATIDRQAASDLGVIAKCAADLAVNIAGVDLSGLALFSPNGQARMVAAARNRSDGWANLIIEPGDGVASRVLKLGGSVNLRHYGLESDSSPHLVDVYCQAEAAYGMLAVPIEQSGSIVGVVYGGVRRPTYIGDRGRVALTQVARLFSAAACSVSGSCQIDMTSRATARGRNEGCPLSPRELRILELLGEGHSTRNIAAAEFLSVNTVRTYVQSALWKLDAHSRLEAVAIARKARLI